MYEINQNFLQWYSNEKGWVLISKVWFHPTISQGRDSVVLRHCQRNEKTVILEGYDLTRNINSFIHSFKYWLIFCFISGASFNRNCNCHIFHFLIYPSNDWRTRQKFWNCFPICIAIDLKNGFYIYFPLENSKWKLWILKHKSSQVLYKA